tara:strand:+ start:593 stop:811 length:219 start_codon:yes stop_codon:yes gene_type:complete
MERLPFMRVEAVQDGRVIVELAVAVREDQVEVVLEHKRQEQLLSREALIQVAAEVENIPQEEQVEVQGVQEL